MVSHRRLVVMLLAWYGTLLSFYWWSSVVAWDGKLLHFPALFDVVLMDNTINNSDTIGGFNIILCFIT
jgi:hypothetical protein